MFNVITKYDKIYDEELGKDVRKKVFMIRGDEAYARSTDVVLTYTTPVSGDVKGFKTSLTATVHRNIGSSKVAFYDGGELLGMTTIGSGVHTAPLSNIYLSYVNEHQLYAEFVGNSQCLGSRSKRVPVTVAIPSSLATSITFNNPTTQINTGGSATISATARMNNETVDDGTEMLFYDNDTLVGTGTTIDGVASVTATDMTEGKHTIRAVIEESSTLTGATSSYDLLVGYDISFNTYPSTIINGIANTVKISVKKWDGTAVGSASVSLTDQSNQTTNSSGIATFTYVNATTKDYTASYSGSSKTMKMYAFTPSSITITSPSSIVGLNESADLTVTLNGTGDKNNISIHITGATVSPQSISFPNNNVSSNTTTYTGSGIGDVTVTATLGNVSKSYIIKDYLMYWTPTVKKNTSADTVVAIGTISETPTGYMWYGRANTWWRFKAQSLNCQMEFDLLETSTNMFGFGTTDYMTVYPSIKAGDHVKVTLQNGEQKAYVNEELVGTLSNEVGGDWALKFLSNVSGPQYLKINNLKIKRL